MDRYASTRPFALGVLLATLAVACVATAWAQEPPPPASAADAQAAPAATPVNAVWLERSFVFTYFGYGTYYSCFGLRDKIAYILKQVGARPDLSVQGVCYHSGGPDRMPSIRIKVALPVEATPEVLAQMAEEQSKRELVARVQGKGANEATAQFAADRRVVEFDGSREDYVDNGDCELFEQLLPKVLEPLGVRKAPGSVLNCAPRNVLLGSVKLKLETLHAQAAPAAADAAH